jgi:predicted alpha-1,2-mannosidase
MIRRALFLLLLGGAGYGVERTAAGDNPVDLANPLVGTASLDDPQLIGNAPPPGEEAYTGFVWPGPALPHRDRNLEPINKDLAEAADNHGIIFPYNHARRTMLGFSSRVSNLTLMPVVGDWTVPPDRSYASAYDKQSEKASPGYYTVYFPDHKIKVELTTSESADYYRFTFPRTDRGTVLIDRGPGNEDVEIVGDHTIRGPGGRGRRGFTAEFSKPFQSFGTFRQNLPAVDGGRVHRNDVTNPDSRNESGNYAGCYLNFSTTEGESIVVKITTGQPSGLVDSKISGGDFDAIRQQAAAAWSQKLNLIEVKGGTAKERQLFYSTLYHSLATPSLETRKGQNYWGMDRQRHVADHDRYSPVAFWDTGRNQIVLLTLLEPELKLDVLRTHLDRAREGGWMDTSFHGDNAVFMYLGDWDRGLNFDQPAVYEYLRKNATDPAGPRGCLAEYLAQGWIHDEVVSQPSPPYADGNAGVAKTLEYSWDDYELALYAKKLGKEDDYKMFLARAHNYTNVFDPSTGFMRGRNADGSWISPFNPLEPYYNFMMKEANGWQTLWLVPHDVQGLINLLGGREKFCAKLDEFFSTPYHPQGVARDVTGMIGQYCQGNQPDQQTAYYYDWGGEPWKTQEIVRRILRLMYGSDEAGLAYPGMDDQGSTSSWYVFSAMGFYPVNPASPDYIIGSPVFDEVTLHLGNGKDFVIVAHNNSDTNLYIQSATLNGQPLNRPWFSHAEIVNGGKLVFEMGPTPNRNWGNAPDAAPPSMSR